MSSFQIVVAPNGLKNVEAQYVEMMVPLYSYGCKNKVKKTLSHIKGIYSINVEYPQQKVTVWGICNKYEVLEMMRSKRKEARFWNAEDHIVSQTQLEELNKTFQKHGQSRRWKLWNKLAFGRANSM